MNNLISGQTIKDWLIIFTLIILSFLIIKIRKLKKIIREETLSRLMPQVGLTIEGDFNKVFYLKNYSTSIARNIRIEDTDIAIDDFGFKTPIKVVFERVDSLNPMDKVELNFRIFSRDSEADPDTKNRYMNHIMFTDFDCRIYYDNIQNMSFSSLIVNRNRKLSIREISRVK